MLGVESYKIIIIITYFGKHPWYFAYFLHSCKFNSTIDFVIFLDCEYEYEVPANVKIILISFEEVRILASKKLGFQVTIEFPYKLCDFKPAYGLIFEDFIGDYHFWGQSDIDIIYGDLRMFLTTELLASTDFVNVRHDYTTGCFTLCRNNNKMNVFFKRSKDYKKVFTKIEYFGFDELNFKHCELNEGKQLFEIETEIECFTHIIKSAMQKNEINAHFDFIMIEGVPGKLKFNNGKLIYKNRFEVILYHLYWLKKIYTPEVILTAVPNIYHISPTRIYFTNDKFSTW